MLSIKQGWQERARNGCQWLRSSFELYASFSSRNYIYHPEKATGHGLELRGWLEVPFEECFAMKIAFRVKGAWNGEGEWRVVCMCGTQGEIITVENFTFKQASNCKGSVMNFWNYRPMLTVTES